MLTDLFWLINGTLISITIPGESRPESNNDKGVIPCL